ncbi:hypothetical protein ACE6H2_014568 [Prunus campanulata]
MYQVMSTRSTTIPRTQNSPLSIEVFFSFNSTQKVLHNSNSLIIKVKNQSQKSIY